MDTLTKVRDEVYEKLYQSGQIPDLIGMTSYGFAEGSIGYAPKHRKYGFTIFAETDAFWRSQGIDPRDPQLLTKLRQWILDNKQYAEGDLDADQGNEDDYENPGNLLNQWITYHILPMKIPTNKLVIHHNEYGYVRSNPNKLGIPVMEFYASFGKRRLFKLYESAASQGVYINRFPNRDLGRLGNGDEISCDPDKVGCKVLTNDSLTVVNDIENCCIYPIDAPLAYTDEVRDNLQRGRIRFDGISLCPEIMNNDIRKKAATEERYQHVYIPAATIYPYTENMVLNDDCKFVYYNAHDYDWCNNQADEMKAVGRFEIMFKLPPVPRRGTYELRYRVLANGNRGVGQIYLKELLDRLSHKGLKIKAAYDAVCPWLINGIFVEDDKTAYILSDNTTDSQEGAEREKYVNTKRFINSDELRNVRCEIRYAEKLSHGALEGALHALSEVNVYHFLLEDIYKNSMDFKSLGEYTAKFIDKMFM